MKNITEAEIQKGQAVYSPFVLTIYNFWVLDISNSYIWRCPKEIQLQQFNRYVRSNHLDIGVGTGYYLKHCRSISLDKISIMDLNPNCLNNTKKVLEDKGMTPSLYLADIYKQETSLVSQFNSISMNYLLHCLPGSMEEKETCIANAASMLVPGGVLFGATILPDNHLHNAIGKKISAIYNKKGLFCNQRDSLQGLRNALMNNLTNVEISVVGAVALFKGVRA